MRKQLASPPTLHERLWPASACACRGARRRAPGTRRRGLARQWNRRPQRSERRKFSCGSHAFDPGGYSPRRCRPLNQPVAEEQSARGADAVFKGALELDLAIAVIFADTPVELSVLVLTDLLGLIRGARREIFVLGARPRIAVIVCAAEHPLAPRVPFLALVALAMHIQPIGFDLAVAVVLADRPVEFSMRVLTSAAELT
mmetsp:Transcript_91963/g.281388  ORF Transcript_91963/g.281388 Transcript_91963/m.281388 type:complete len:200 (+) Transcript_91963:252-851(+)